MSFLKFKRQSIIEVKSKGEIEDFINYLYDETDKRYSSTKCRGNIIEFELSYLLSLGANRGLYGRYEIFDEGEHIRVKTSIENPFASAGSVIFIIFVLIGGVIAFLKIESSISWIFLILSPFISGAIYLIMVTLFKVTSYFRFQGLIERVKDWNRSYRNFNDT